MTKSETKESAMKGLVAEVKSQGAILGGFVGLLWVIHIINAVVFQGGLSNLGIHPRSLFGLLGILFAPFLHGSFAHLMANTVPLAVLGFFVMQRKKRDLFWVSLLSGLVGGLGVWLIAPAASVTVGASILIFGYLGYLLSRGIFEKRFWPIVGSLLVFFLYGGALFGVLPTDPMISWQGHLFGLIGGILAARLMRAPRIDVKEKEVAGTAHPDRRSSKLRLPAASDDESDAEAEIEADLARARAELKRRRAE